MTLLSVYLHNNIVHAPPCLAVFCKDPVYKFSVVDSGTQWCSLVIRSLCMPSVRLVSFHFLCSSPNMALAHFSFARELIS